MPANFQLGDTEKVQYTLTELDANSLPARTNPADVITVSSSDADACSVVPDATPVDGSAASGWLVGHPKLGTVTITASLQHPDGSPPLTVADALDIVGGVANSISLGLGAPVAQTAAPAAA